ncbi:heme ABC exporter ATP-binding protein CcmA [Rhodobacteraceae bacterium 2CG4]|uniref:Heme ABC exporter ATP-binding protein CcmA n=1 Tax=Halovulum marinum TaxID=2662447 RepID=A0A6L5Z257_9RHOB|nr:heme ABC exporter ATP-binding protein CcmA [Halovulum marinum]MSU90084.1 heme ABC exporter ATP-binding protein CcmA [Halovulum marinum]
MTLSAEDLTCRSGADRLFAPVSFTVPAGGALLLQGPNGAGKTTLLRAIAGLGPRPEGRIALDGAAPWASDGAVALTGHLDAVKPGLTVDENLGFWARLHGRADAAAGALAAFGLGGFGERLAGRLSAGQKRRLGLARLAVDGARLWLLDEPTVSLDADSTAALGRLIGEHLARGGMALIATHLPVPVAAETLRLQPAAARHRTEADPFLAEPGA